MWRKILLIATAVVMVFCANAAYGQATSGSAWRYMDKIQTNVDSLQFLYNQRDTLDVAAAGSTFSYMKYLKARADTSRVFGLELWTLAVENDAALDSFRVRFNANLAKQDTLRNLVLELWTYANDLDAVLDSLRVHFNTHVTDDSLHDQTLNVDCTALSADDSISAALIATAVTATGAADSTAFVADTLAAALIATAAPSTGTYDSTAVAHPAAACSLASTSKAAAFTPLPNPR